MIIAIASQNGSHGKRIVANNLAVLRARSGHRVCLVDTDPKKYSSTWSSERGSAGIGPRVPARAINGRELQTELATVNLLYNDIVIDTEGRDTPESRSALIAARLVLVPVQVDQVDMATQYKLIARLNSARMFNPGLRVLFVIVVGQSDPTKQELAAVRFYVSGVMSATLAATVIHAPVSCVYGDGRCVCAAETCASDMAAEMHSLYRAVYAP